MLNNVFGDVLYHFDSHEKKTSKPVMRVPESHDIYVLPRGCGRRVAIKAFGEGSKDRVSFIYIEEEDVVLGGYEDIIIDGATEIIEILLEKPKAVFVYTTCIDDLLGTDHNVFLERLREVFPQIDFTIGHMNPISLESAMPPPASKLYSYFGLLKKSDIQEKRVNIIGAINDPIVSRDLSLLLEEKGYVLTDLYGCKSYEEFQRMANAKVTVVISPMGIPAAKLMEKNLGIPYIEAFVNYDLNQIADDYNRIFQFLGEEVDTSIYMDKGEKSLHYTKEMVGDIPIAIDSNAVLRPIHLGNFLLENGFNIGFMFEGMILDCDYHLYEKFTKGDYGAKILDSKGLINEIVGFEKAIAIGETSYRRLGTKGYIDFNHSEVNYGFSGLIKLMNMVDEYLKEVKHG